MFSAIEKYFRFVMNIRLNPVSDSLSDTFEDKVIFIFESDRYNGHYLMKALGKRNHIIMLGFNVHSNINLLDFKTLKTQFERTISSYSSLDKLFIEKEIKERLKMIFNSHGEESLFKHLNSSRYNFLNGIKLYQMQEINREESIKNFLVPGLISWQKFKKRIDQQEILLRYLFNDTELSKVNDILKKLEIFIESIRKLSFSDSDTINETILNKNIDLLDKIDNILSKKYFNLVKANGSIQDSSNR